MNRKWLFLPIMIVVAGVGFLLLVAAGPSLNPKGFWKLRGNSGTDAATNFLGTTDAQDLVIKTNDTEAMRITPDGTVGIGTQHPGGFGVTGPTASVDIRTPDPSAESGGTNVSISSDLGQGWSKVENLHLGNRDLMWETKVPYQGTKVP